MPVYGLRFDYVRGEFLMNIPAGATHVKQWNGSEWMPTHLKVDGTGYYFYSKLNGWCKDCAIAGHILDLYYDEIAREIDTETAEEAACFDAESANKTIINLS